MKKLLAWLLLWPVLALAQPGAFPALIGAKGVTPPTNCTIGQLFFDTDATAGSNIYGCTAANTWTAQGSSGIATGSAVTGGGADRVLYEDGSQNLAASSNFIYSDSTKRLTVGTGSGTSTGIILGYTGTSGWGGIWTTDQTPAQNNAIIGGTSGQTYVRGASHVTTAINGNDLHRVSTTALQLGGSYKTYISNTAPTVASGGCTSPTAVTANGTAYFSVGVGTSCSGSQPLVFTLPAATTGWNCYARNATNPAGSAPAQSSAVSTTSVTITNYNRTTGVAAAWTDADVVVVSCLGG